MTKSTDANRATNESPSIYYIYLVQRNLHRSLHVPLAEVNGVLDELHLRGVPVTIAGKKKSSQWCNRYTELQDMEKSTMVFKRKAEAVQRKAASASEAWAMTNETPCRAPKILIA